MTITSLYKDYFQKSATFLYPLLDIRRGISTAPIQSYLAWEGQIEADAKNLICLYNIRDDREFLEFEKVKLLNNRYFTDFKEVEDGKGVYIFNLSSIEDDWDYFIKGRYSLLSPSLKRKVRNFYGSDDPNFVYIDSFFNPTKYYPIYADLLGEPIDVLKDVGELCSAPDMERERLDVKVKDLKLNNIDI